MQKFQSAPRPQRMRPPPTWLIAVTQIYLMPFLNVFFAAKTQKFVAFRGAILLRIGALTIRILTMPRRYENP
jgi:hypothetical protein